MHKRGHSLGMTDEIGLQRIAAYEKGGEFLFGRDFAPFAWRGRGFRRGLCSGGKACTLEDMSRNQNAERQTIRGGISCGERRNSSGFDGM